MITVRIKGGLGHQLFQYAPAYSLAERLGQKLVLDTSFYPRQTLRGFKLGKFNITYGETTEKQKLVVEFCKSRYINMMFRKANVPVIPCGDTSYLLETQSDIVPEFFLIDKKNIYIDGYYQSEKYFMNCRNDLLKQISITYHNEKEFLSILENINMCNSVAVHVRRGDFLKAQNDNNPNHYLLKESYYHNALRYVDEHLENPIFFWFSDDIEWVKNNFGKKKNFRFVDLKTKNADIAELMLMKNCKHIIAANSTFSWWASWLNEYKDALHLCPAKRYGNLHMIPSNWIKISVE